MAARKLNELRGPHGVDARGDGGDLGDVYGALFYAMPVMTILTDDRAVILDASRSALDFLNVSAATLRTRPLLHFVARHETRTFRGLVRQLAGGGLGPVVIHLRPRHGTPRAMVLTAVRVPRHAAFVWTGLPDEERPDDEAKSEARPIEIGLGREPEDAHHREDDGPPETALGG